MEAAALAVVESGEGVSRFGIPLSLEESTQYRARTLRIELAGKDRLEKALIIGEELSGIYNEELYRGEGKRSWDQWLKTELPLLLPEAEGKSTDWGDDRRWLYEARACLTKRCPALSERLVSTQSARTLQSLIPRRRAGSGQWNPAILDDSDKAEGVAVVWELACATAKLCGRSNPSIFDIRAAREELRPTLEEKGLIRSAHAGFQAATAARVEAAQQRTINVTAVDPAEQERKAAEFRQTMANIRETKAERQANVEAQGIKDELSKAERERRHLLDEEVRHYNRCLHGASKAIHELLSYLESLSRIHGTQLLDEMRTVDVLGMITVSDDMDRLGTMGSELVRAVGLARTSSPSTGMDATTINV